MIKKRIIGVLLFYGLTACTNSDVDNKVLAEKVEQGIDKQHAIDQFLENCLADTMNFITMGITQCVVEAHEQWEETLNRLVKQLDEVLPDTLRNDFDASQRNWEVYFKAQTNFSDELFSQSKGTMYSTIRVHNNMTVLRERALLLEAFLEEAEMLRAFSNYSEN